MEYLQQIADSSQFPTLTAFVLGLMTAISPCPLATNISAIGYISKDIQNKRKVFWNGIIYTLGRVIGYTVLGVIMIIILRQGASVFKIQKAVGTWGELLIGPFLILIGIFMLDLIKINFSLFGRQSQKLEKKAGGGSYWNSLFLGVAFALAFCPYSGVLFFGGLIPLAVASPAGYFLPCVFAIATALPVIILAWFLAFSLTGIGSFYKKVKAFEFWLRKVVAIIFILIGFYYIYIIYIK